jgi:peptidoglycan hydrolase-like amidase
MRIQKRFPLLVLGVLTTICLSNTVLQSNDYNAVAAPLYQNPYTECPPNSTNIWVRLDTNYFDQPRSISIPFDSGQATINGRIYVNYLLGVLIGEVAPTVDFTPVGDETLKAMAIAARTVAYKNCGTPIANWPYRGIDDNIKQNYDPTQRDIWLSTPALGQAELNRYQQAINDTTGMYLTYNGAVFDAQYRDKSDEWTDSLDEDGDGTFEPHKGIYDPAGLFHATPVYTMPGLMQVNSNHWATGQNHGELLPHYN